MSRHARPPRKGHLLAILLAVLSTLLISLAVPGLNSSASAKTRPAALIIDPFPEQHSPGYTDQDVVDILKGAGFKTKLLVGSQVTIDSMRTMPKYSIVYLFTHSGPLPNSDAAVSSGDTRHARYKSYFNNSTIVRMHIESPTGMKYFDAVTGRYIQRYMPKFSPHTIFFLNACTALAMKKFWSYLKAAGVGTFISWEHHVTTVGADRAAHDLFASMARGLTVDKTMHRLIASGVGVSNASAPNGKIGKLGFHGDGKNTFQKLGAPKVTATPTPSPSPTSTSTATPAPTSTPTSTATPAPTSTATP